MRNRLVLAIVLVLGSLAAQAQQAGSTGGGTPGGSTTLGSGTPGVAGGTTGTTFGTPGAEEATKTPGGTIPMGAGTQDTTNLPNNPPNLNNSGLPPTR
jgi:hypothetical protein